MQRAGAWMFGLFATAFIALLSVSAPARAAGSVHSISANALKIEFQHPGYTAQGFPTFDGRKYRVCLGKLTQNSGKDCVNIDSQSVTVSNQIYVGTTYRVEVTCFCKEDRKLAVPRLMHILDVEHHHAAPPPPPPPRIVRLRSAQSGLCLYPQQNGLLYSGTCGPLSIMRFSIEDGAAGGTQFRHVASGKCIHGSFPRPNPTVVLAACGKIGTGLWLVDYKNGTYRLNFLRTEDQVSGNPPVIGPAGCLKPSPVQGGQATKNDECRWEMWVYEDMFYLDPA